MHSLNKINDADSFLLVEGTNSIWKGNTWKASPGIIAFFFEAENRLRCSTTGWAWTLKWEQRWRKMEGGQITPLDLQGREWMDISATIGDRFFSVYFMTKYPFVYPRFSSHRNFKFSSIDIITLFPSHRPIGNLKYRESIDYRNNDWSTRLKN